MTDTVFREATKPSPEPTKKDKTLSDTKIPSSDVEIEAPYLDYETINKKPYLADHFELGDTWDDPAGGFPKELSIIEGYIENEIKSGKIGNDISSAKEILKLAEKMTNTKKETRMTVKIPIIAEYMKFLMKVDKVKFNAQRYGTH